MTRSRQDPPIPPQALSPAGSSGAATAAASPQRDNQTAIRMFGVAVLIHMLRSRRLMRCSLRRYRAGGAGRAQPRKPGPRTLRA